MKHAKFSYNVYPEMFISFSGGSNLMKVKVWNTHDFYQVIKNEVS